MGTKVTVDEHGCVVSFEFVPNTPVPTTTKKRRSVRKTKSQQYEAIDTPPSPVPIRRRIGTPGGNKPSGERVTPSLMRQQPHRKTLLIPCPACKAAVEEHLLPLHMREQHGAIQEEPKSTRTPKKALVYCPYCSEEIKKDSLSKHIRIWHGTASTPQAVPKRQQVAYSGKQLTTRKTPRLSTRAELDQSFGEQRYAGKYIGQMRHDIDGKYGSLPLYDNYDDESSPD